MTFRNTLQRWALCLLLGLVPAVSQARVKFVALPERAATIIRLDNPNATLIEEERTLTLQKGTNHVDFSWNGVRIEPSSIRLSILDHPKQVRLINVSYPPNEKALVWEIFADQPFEEKVRISYLLAGIDRLVEYRGSVDHDEKNIQLKSYLILRNFSGEDFDRAKITLDYGQSFVQDTRHGETRKLLFLKTAPIKLQKIWTFDARTMPWDPEKLDTNVGIPVSYRLINSPENGLGKHHLWSGKVRVYQDDGHGSTIFLGEDKTKLVPVGEKMTVGIGKSRDIVVTQRRMSQKQINVRRDNHNNVVIYDLDVVIQVKIENFKDKPAVLTLIEEIPGQWTMKDCNFKYTQKDFKTLKFEIPLAPKEKKTLTMHYVQENLPISTQQQPRLRYRSED